MGYFRVSKFSRAAPTKGIRLSERDLKILRAVHRHRFISSFQIIELLEDGTQTVLRRLRLLFDSGNLERPRCQLDYYHKGGSRPIVYSLGNKGAAVLKQQSVPGICHLRWGEKNRNVGRTYLEHVLLVSKIMVAIEVACRHAGARLLYEPELLSDSGTQGQTHFHWRVQLRAGQSLGVIPDRTFALEFTAPSGNVTRTHFFLEADRGTMPIVRENLTQTSLLRKFLSYQTTWSNGLHRELFGFKRFRILTITPSPVRLQGMINACQSLKRGRGLFLFADIGTFEKPENILRSPLPTAVPGLMATLLD